MATQSLFPEFDPEFTWTGGNSMKLAVPIRFTRTSDVKFRRATDSLDRANREVLTIGAKVEEAEIEIRYDDTPGDMKDMLEAGADGTILNYFQSAAAGTSLPFIVLTPRDQIIITPDPQTHTSHGHWMARFKIRLASGSLDAILT